MTGKPATKPVMYNWIGSPWVALGWSSEPTLKMPSLLAAMAILGMIVTAGRRLLPLGAEGRTIGLLAGVFWLASYSTLKLIYLARPDMLVVALLTGAWCCATMIFLNAQRLRGVELRAWQLGLWLCAAGAALTKGLPALLVLVYVLLGAKLIVGHWRAVGKTGILWGLPLAMGLFGLWFYGVYRADPEHFRNVFMGKELVGRIHSEKYGGSWAILLELWQFPLWFLAYLAPASFLAVLTWLHVPARQWLRHPTGPATLWVFLTILFFSLSAGKRADYIAPAYPMAAILAGYWLAAVAPKHRVTPRRSAVIGTLVALGLCIYFMAGSPAAISGLGDNAAQFARRASRIVGDDPVAFIETGYNPLQPLMGRNQAGRVPTDEQLRVSPWIVVPYDPSLADPVLLSRPIPEVSGRQPALLGLYHNPFYQQPSQ